MTPTAAKPRARKRPQPPATQRPAPAAKSNGRAPKADSNGDKAGKGGRRLADAFEAVSVMPVLA
ncbi:MAG: hypothetical protein ACRDK1_05310, partial [Solirubrobacterales bacterium]